MEKINVPLFAILCVMLSPMVAAAQPGDGTTGIFDRLQQYDPLLVSIETDLAKLESDKLDESWQPAVFTVFSGDSAVLRLDVQVATRGNMRKKNCGMPPLKIRFYDQKPLSDSLADINELKMVSNCDESRRHEEWVRREYLLYELYNLVTEQSFRVKSATVRFGQTGKTSGTRESFSFFIESEEAMAARIGGKTMKPRIGSVRSLDSVAYDRMSLFQFMIGNTDWSVRARHNIKLVYLPPTNSIIPVPYDFDYAGAVGADYAAPNSDYPIESVQERYYLGACRVPGHYQRLFDFYLGLEKSLLARIENASCIEATSRTRMTAYIGEFFRIIGDARLANRDILKNCNKGR
jgi:hypothetical protein